MVGNAVRQKKGGKTICATPEPTEPLRRLEALTGTNPMNETIAVEINVKWVRRVKSPLFWIVSALTGVSLTFASLWLYWCGQGKFPEASWWLVPSCFAVIYLVPLFYIKLAGEVIACICRQTATPQARKLPRIMGAAGRLIGRLREK